MRTVRRKFSRLYLTKKLNDNMKMHESEPLSKGIKLVQLNAVNADDLNQRKDWHRSGRSKRTGETTRET